MSRAQTLAAALLAGLMLAGVTLAGWGLHDLARARGCLENGAGVSGWTGSTMTDAGCLIKTEHQGTILLALYGPDFGTTLLAMAVAVGSAVLLVVQLARRRRDRKIAA
ncbi:hypothetical protein [Micromonospora sp. L32]|uniref:hypothetical protein n=1 Tax=Micromonospora sp. L32 TaxID=3452214 RepID=UPI003F8C2E2B